ncbi:MAG TPA: TonB-dependent receptor, partial [Dyella sp.]|uniref:TonB-dependent receptor domain-containing protein n=1 Tax=Dyella sp. TaxID=1869338 RepID=UPI002F94B04A
RNLGTARTLVLVNGRRYVGSSAGSSEVDVNLIPVEWLDRVEIITGGASAVYGADAVTGVVNFILKKKYEGATLNAQYGTTQHGGFDRKKLALTGGMNFAGDRGNVAVSVEHSDQGSLEFADRFGRKSYTTVQTPDGATDSALMSNAGSYTVTDGGTFFLGNSATNVANRYVFNPDGSVRPQRFGGMYDNAGRCSDCDSLHTNQVLQLQPKYGRTSINSVASFDISPEHRLYFEGSFSHINVKIWRQPAFGSGANAYTIMRDNAYIDPGLAALMDANGLNSIAVSRFDVDAGRRGEDTTRNVTRGVFGANGVIVDDWEYDASLNYGVTRETRYNLNNRINDRFHASIDAVRDPATGQIVCRSSISPGSINPQTGGVLDPIALGGGCVPTSIFGTGAIDPAAAQWFNTTTSTKTRITQFVGGGSVTNNNLFQMPGDAGAASMAMGVEFRRETSRQVTDPLDVAGLTFLNAIQPASGAYNVKEAYAEMALPVLADRMAVKNLTFDAAVRASDYSSIGRTKAWRWGLDWSIDDNLRLRGTMSSAVRAPNIDELYSGQSENFFTITDPCSDNQIRNGANPAVRRANCQALGIPPGWTSANSATIRGVSGSSPALRPEVGRTWTAGMVLTPQFAPGLGVTLDYWNIKLTDAISAPSGADIARQCVDAPSGVGNSYCGNAQRDPVTHELVFINSTVQNISSLSTSGIDIGAYYSHDLGAGRIRFNLNASRVIGYTEHPFQDDPTIAIERNGTLGFPKWKGTLSTTYTLKGWTFNWNTRYASRMLLVANESYRSNPIQTTPIRAGASFFNDVRASHAFKNSGWQVYAGITNVFDCDPPVNMFGTTPGSALYDTLGRGYYVGANYTF